MKRILTLLTLCFLLYQAQAQVLFLQDFQSGSLDPMIAIDVDGKTVAPQIAGLAGPTWKVVPGDGDNLLVVSTSWFQPIGKADDWLISDTLRVTEPNTFLVWEAYTPDANYRDGYEVRASVTDKEIASFTNVLLTVPQEMTFSTTRSLNLDAFIGQDMFFAFRNNSNDKFLLYMDNIRVEVLKDNDAVVKTVNFEKYQPLNAVVPITVTIENHGAQPLTSIVFSYTANGVTNTDTITGMNIAPLKTTEITHNSNLVLPVLGTYPVEVNISFPNGVEDQNPVDNTGSKFIYVVGTNPKKVVVEEGTGTWCTWCPRGDVFMHQIANDFEDIIIPIAVHNGDPMAITEYDGPFSSTLSGYPSGHVDRKVVDTDPSNFPSAIQDVRDRPNPIAVEVTTQFDEQTRTLTISAEGFLWLATTRNDLRFSAVITEDSVTGPSPGYDQINAYAGGANGPMGGYENLPNPVPASMMVYDFVARAILGGFEGIENSIPDTVLAQEPFYIEFSYVIPAEFEPEHMKAIVMVLDEETGEILNADMEDVLDDETTTSVPIIPVGASLVYPNPATDIMNLSVTFQSTDAVSMKIYDPFGRLITNLGNLDLSKGNATERIDVSEMPSGSYILELRHKNAVTALPFNKI